MVVKEKKQKGLAHSVSSYLEDFFSSHEGNIPNCNLYQAVMCEVEKPLIEQTLKSVCGNQSKAAAVLGINRNTLKKKMVAFGITSHEDVH